KICKLKDEEWKYGITSQLQWFKKFVSSRDIHLILKKNDKIIGYLLLRDRKFNYKINEKKFGNYYLFDSFIIKKKFRKKGYGYRLMNAAKKIIKEKNYFSILTSDKKKINYYKKNGWKITNKIMVLDHHDKWAKLIFNSKTNKYLNVYFKPNKII
ncbi:GNAT family N-acetyltransferase, partial [Candidatus Pelagibacter sp.]|nr:GNAT family N-acetyltransferase [Candidatus Pelagibacter sp.]